MQIFNVPFATDGLDLLSRHLHERYQKDPLALSQVTIFLTTRRACRRLQSLMLRNGACSSTILPRLFPFGDLSSKSTVSPESDFGSGSDFSSGEGYEREGLSREEALGKVLKALTAQNKIPTLQAVPLAKAFLKMEFEGSLHQIDWRTSLETLFPEDLASHRQSSLERLKELLEGLQDDLPFFPGATQVRVLKKYRALWSQSVPTSSSHAAYAFGVQAKSALERTVLKALATFPLGTLLLSGLDRDSYDETFEAFTPPHPQSNHGILLKTLQIKRQDIPDWSELSKGPPSRTSSQSPKGALSKGSELVTEAQRGTQGETQTEARARLLRKAFHATFGERRPPDRHEGLSIVACRDFHEETRLISLALRHLIEDPNKKALLVTPDRGLERSVTQALKRYDLVPDTVSGIPLIRTEAGTFLSLLLEAIRDPGSLAQLSLFKHPLYRCGQAPETIRTHARQYELFLLKALTPAAPLPPSLQAFVATFKSACEPFKRALGLDACWPADLLEMHLRLGEILSENQDHRPLVWLGEVGNLVFDTSYALFQSLQHFPKIRGADYPGLLRSLFMEKSVRPSQRVHPRLLILDPQQATLQKADLLILAGMTERNWPSSPAGDPWLSPGMQKRLGLSGGQAQQTLEAHLFTELLTSTPEVLCTYARRTSQGPQNPSSFLIRLETAAACEGLSLDPPLPWQQWAASLVSVETVTPLERPHPSPDRRTRPRRVSVTDIELLNRHPYAFYVRKILNLEKVPRLEKEPGPALFGTLVHQTLEAFLSQDDPSLEALRRLGQEKIAPFQESLTARYFWHTRFEEVARWFIEVQSHLSLPFQSFLECSGQMTLPLPDMPKDQPLNRTLDQTLEGTLDLPDSLTVTAKADRLDRRPDGAVSIIDYKTGCLPTRGEVLSGASPQLALEALILEAGGFQDLCSPSQAQSLEYWHLKSPCKRLIYDQDLLPDLLAHTKTLLEQLIRTYYTQGAPFGAPYALSQDKDINHLSRTQEWLFKMA